MPSPLAPETRDALLLIALYTSVALGGVLAYAHRLPNGRVCIATAAAAAALMVGVTASRDPFLLPVALVSVLLVSAAGVSTVREVRSRR